MPGSTLSSLPPYPRVRATCVYDQLGFCPFIADQRVAYLDRGRRAAHRRPHSVLAKPWAGFWL